MKLDEVSNPEMKARLDSAKLRMRVEELEEQVLKQGKMIMALSVDLGKVQRTMAALISKLGPKQ